MKLIIYGPPRTKKNSAQLIGGGLRPRMIPSKPYRKYALDAEGQLPVVQPIESAVNVKCLYYMPTRRRVDLVNLLEATCDILVHGHVLKDDNCGIVVGHDGSRVLYDKGNPRVEIEITEVNDATYPGDKCQNSHHG